jgi:hypothetical protein
LEICRKSRFEGQAIDAGEPRDAYENEGGLVMPSKKITPMPGGALHKLFEREMCSENISGIIQNNLIAPTSKVHQIQ